MVRTRRQTQGSESDDDAPEEVQFTSSKANAEQARQAEKDAALKLKAKQQAARKEQEAKRQEQKQASKRKRGSGKEQASEDGEEEAGPSGRQQETPAANGSGYSLPDADLLPAEVLEALEQDRPAKSVQPQDPSDQREAQRKAHEAAVSERKRRRLEQLKKGPVVVTVLKAVKKMAAGTASSFLQDQLYGARIKRSGEMLQPIAGRARMTPGGRALAPAKKFV